MCGGCRLSESLGSNVVGYIANPKQAAYYKAAV